MRRFKRILLVRADGEADTLLGSEFLGFVRSNDAEVTVAGWCAMPPSSLLASLFEPRQSRAEACMRLGLQKRLDAIAAALAKLGVDVDTIVLEGDPAEAIVSLAESGKFDLVVKSAEGARSDAPFTFGPLDRTLVRHSPVPVLLVKAQPHRAERILVAVDVNNAAHEAVNDVLMELAIGQAALLKAELHVAHAWELVGEAALRSGAFTEVDAERIDAWKAKERAVRHEALQRLFARHDGSPVRMVEHLVEGPAPLAIGAVAQLVQPQLLIMGVTPRRRLTSLVLNDLAEAMLGALDCSVLLVNVNAPPEAKA